MTSYFRPPGAAETPTTSASQSGPLIQTATGPDAVTFRTVTWCISPISHRRVLWKWLSPMRIVAWGRLPPSAAVSTTFSTVMWCILMPSHVRRRMTPGAPAERGGTLRIVTL